MVVEKHKKSLTGELITLGLIETSICGLLSFCHSREKTQIKTALK